MGRMRVFPEDVAYMYLSMNDGPLLESVGILRFGVGTKAWDWVHFELGLAFGRWAVALNPAVSIKVYGPVRVGIRGAFNPSRVSFCPPREGCPRFVQGGGAGYLHLDF